VKVRRFYKDPAFIGAMADRVRDARREFPDQDVHVAFTAHSIPMSMASTSEYVQQLEEACGLVAAEAGIADWKLVYQSRSGPPTQPWLEPDIGDHLKSAGKKNVIIAPIGFLSDHMEVLYDLDTEAADVSRELGIHMVRAGTVGTHPLFVRMIRQLVMERMEGDTRDLCAPDCCPAPVMRRP
jgi:ferrochelatase